MLNRSIYVLPLVLLLTLWACTPAGETVQVTERPDRPTVEEEEEVDPQVEAMADTIQIDRFDLGKMWTFEEPPIDYFTETYDFNPDEQWFTEAKRGALRFGENCSASFISPNGLVLTNHHCSRPKIHRASRAGEALLEEGFYAPAGEHERRVPDLHVDQLVDIESVTDRVYEAVADLRTGQVEARARARQNRAQSIERELTREAQEQDTTLRVEVVELYDGGEYSAYTYRRFHDVRLVMAPELQTGFFGGSEDNFTYPRYTLDVAFFRVYDADGEPHEPSDHFHWSTDGAEEGDAVFTVGSPGSTDRLKTVSQLEFLRDHRMPRQVEAMDDRQTILENYLREHPEHIDEFNLRNVYFNLENSLKATEGELAGLRDRELIARREANERQLRQQISEVDTLQERVGGAFEQIRRLQISKQGIARQLSAFTFLGNSDLGSPLLARGTYAYIHDNLRRQGAGGQQLEQIREQALARSDWPEELEVEFITQRIEDMKAYLGDADPTVRRVLQDREPEEVASRLVDRSALADSSRFASLMEDGYLQSDDPSIRIIEPMGSLFLQLTRQNNDYLSAERNLNAELGRARLAVSDERVPPDATFSPRIADGVIQGYESNGTRAPAFTTFYGMYDRNFSQLSVNWALPRRWLEAPEQFDRSTPLNLVSTNDIAGGNSGSPLLNRDLEVVGVVFDSNMEGLQNRFIYRDDAARAVSVDSRGILHALEVIYRADRVAEELRTGRLIEDEDFEPAER